MRRISIDLYMTIITSNLAVENDNAAKITATFAPNSIYDEKYYLTSLFNKPKYQAFFNEDSVGYFANEYLKELTREHPESEKLFRESQTEALTKFANGPLVPKTLKSGVLSKDKREAIVEMITCAANIILVSRLSAFTLSELITKMREIKPDIYINKRILGSFLREELEYRYVKRNVAGKRKRIFKLKEAFEDRDKYCRS